MPPRTAFDPSRCAFELRKRFSLPLADFHDITVAPYSSTSIDSPVGKLAVTRELSCEMETWGVGMTGETGILAGFFERSIAVLARGWIVTGEENRKLRETEDTRIEWDGSDASQNDNQQ